MTSTTDTTGHPDVAEISDLTEGLLPPSRSADVRRHLDTCDLCADVQASLEEIRGLLGTLPGPVRMPDDVARRIDAALAAEALLSSTADSDAPDVSRETPSTASTPSASSTTPSAPQAPSAADRPSGHAHAASTGPGRKDRKRGGRRRGVALAALFGVTALGLGGALLFSFTGDESDTSARSRASSADTFAQSTLETKVTDLLATTQGTDRVKSFGVGGDDTAHPRVLDMPTVPECVQKGIGRNDAALAAEQGTYQGRDTLLVVLPDPSNSTKVDAYLMDRTCATQSSASPAKILLRDSYTRH